jgi:flagellar motor switch protein FliN/FliY
VATLDLLSDVSIEISVELGRAKMTFAEVMAMKVGNVIELNKLAGEAGDVYVNGTLIGRGEIVVVDDRFGIRVFDVVSRPHLRR